jgi:hypothetical protein
MFAMTDDSLDVLVIAGAAIFSAIAVGCFSYSTAGERKD